MDEFHGPLISVVQSTGSVEYTDCFSAEGSHIYNNECPGYDTKKSDDEVPVKLEICGMQSTSSLPSLWPGVVAPDRVLSMGQIKLNCVIM